MPEYRKYVALGDSMSIDLYPALDAGEMDVAVALERSTAAGAVAPLGAASLFFRNSEQHWPDDLGNDLSSLYPDIDFQNLATDGATEKSAALVVLTTKFSAWAFSSAAPALMFVAQLATACAPASSTTV